MNEVERSMFASALRLLNDREWSCRHAAENSFCMSCATEKDRWTDQHKTGHHDGCDWVDTANKIKLILWPVDSLIDQSSAFVEAMQIMTTFQEVETKITISNQMWIYPALAEEARKRWVKLNTEQKQLLITLSRQLKISIDWETL